MWPVVRSDTVYIRNKVILYPSCSVFFAYQPSQRLGNGQYFGENHQSPSEWQHQPVFELAHHSSGTGKSRMGPRAIRAWFSRSCSICVSNSEGKGNSLPQCVFLQTEIRYRVSLSGRLPTYAKARLATRVFYVTCVASIQNWPGLYKTKQPTYAALARQPFGQRSELNAVLAFSVRPLFMFVILHSSYSPEKLESKLLLEETSLDPPWVDAACLSGGVSKWTSQADALLRWSSRSCREKSYQRSRWEKHLRCRVLVFRFLLVLVHIYLLTHSNISDLEPPGTLPRSGRARENADASQAPVTGMPKLDSLPWISRSNLANSDWTTSVKFEFMARFGRPMWVRTILCRHHLAPIWYYRF